MALLPHHPLHRAEPAPTLAPTGFCDACGAATYVADAINVREGMLLLTLHAGCAGRLQSSLYNLVTFGHP